MITVMLSNQKGGCGKTSTTFAMACGLVHRGYKVLAIDSDAQCNLTFAAGINPMQTDTLYDVYENAKKISDVIVNTSFGFDLVPGDLRLTTADLAYSGRVGREYILKRALNVAHYDFCIIDTPPQIGLLVENAIAITDSLIIPLTADAFSIQGVANYNNLISMLKEVLDTHFSVDGLLITRYSDRTKLSKTLKEQIYDISKNLNTFVYDSIIREAVIIREMPYRDSNMFDTHADAPVVKDYDLFIDQFLSVKGVK